VDELKSEVESFLKGTVAGQSGLTLRFLDRHLKGYLPRREDREDAISEVRYRLLRRPGELDLPNRAAWLALVATVGSRIAIDMLRSKHGDLDLEYPEDVPEKDYPFIEVIALLMEDAEAAGVLDELWLGVAPKLSAAERKRRLLAAQLFYLNNLHWDQICQILSANGTVTREMLDEWLGERSVLLCLAYAKLHRGNERLSGTIIAPENPLPSCELDKLSRLALLDSPAKPPAGWTWSDLRIVFWRYRNGLPDRKILQMCSSVDQQAIDGVVQICEPRMPFAQNAKRLVAGAQARRVQGEPFKAQGLWRRLAFQYGFIEDLPQKHILERIDPATKVIGARFTAGMLAVGLAGRYLSEIIAYAQERYSCQENN